MACVTGTKVMPQIGHLPACSYSMETCSGMGQMYFTPDSALVEAAAVSSGIGAVAGVLLVSMADPPCLGSSIFWMASRSWLSESSMNCPEVTMRSPSFNPPITWYMSLSACRPNVTVRGSNFPPSSAMKTVFFSPLRRTAISGTNNTEGSNSEMTCTEANIPGLRK